MEIASTTVGSSSVSSVAADTQSKSAELHECNRNGVFGLVGVSLAAYGFAGFLAVWLIKWEPAESARPPATPGTRN